MPVYAAHLRKIIKEGVASKEDYERPLEGTHSAATRSAQLLNLCVTKLIVPKARRDVGYDLLVFPQRQKKHCLEPCFLCCFMCDMMSLYDAGFHVVLDAGNGSGGFLATDVLEPLGADISGAAQILIHQHCLADEDS